MDVIEKAVVVLNEALEADKDALINLMNHRVSCNQKMADHPTIQVRGYNIKTNEKVKYYDISCLGLINGLFGTDENDCGFIAAEYDIDNNTGLILDIHKFIDRRKE